MIPVQKKQASFLRSTIEFILLLAVVFLVRTFGFGLYQVPSGSMETTMLVGDRFLADKFTYLFRKPQRGEIIAFNDVTYKYSENYFINLFQRYVYGPSNITKRIIGLPGDVVQGVVEEGRPVIYINNEKLLESYLNKYPLLCIYTEDREVLKARVDRELSGLLRGRSIDPSYIDALREKRMADFTKTVSYDPSVSYADQKFYSIKKERVVTGANGEIFLIYPGVSLRPSIGRVERGKNYWNGSDDFYIELKENEYWGMGDNRLGSKDSRWFGPIRSELIHGRIVFRIWSLDSDWSWWIFDLLSHPLDFWNRLRKSRFFQILS